LSASEKYIEVGKALFLIYLIFRYLLWFWSSSARTDYLSGHVLKPETTGTKQPERNHRNDRNKNRKRPEPPKPKSNTTGTNRNFTSLISPPLLLARHLLPRDLYFPRDFTNLRYRYGKRGRHGKAKRNKAIFFSNLHEISTICLLNSIRRKLGRIL
jgi:hypothetical protein